MRTIPEHFQSEEDVYKTKINQVIDFLRRLEEKQLALCIAVDGLNERLHKVERLD